MENQLKDVNPVVPVQQKTKLSQKIGYGVAAATTYALATVPAHAESSLSAVGEAFTSELDGAKAVIVTILSAAAIVLGLIVGWRYMKRGANSA